MTSSSTGEHDPHEDDVSATDTLREEDTQTSPLASSSQVYISAGASELVEDVIVDAGLDEASDERLAQRVHSEQDKLRAARQTLCHAPSRSMSSTTSASVSATAEEQQASPYPHVGSHASVAHAFCFVPLLDADSELVESGTCAQPVLVAGVFWPSAALIAPPEGTTDNLIIFHTWHLTGVQSLERARSCSALWRQHTQTCALRSTPLKMQHAERDRKGEKDKMQKIETKEKRGEREERESEANNMACRVHVVLIRLQATTCLSLPGRV